MHVAFDIGNVLVKFDIEKFTKQLIDEVDVDDTLFFMELLQPMQDLGLLTIRQALKIHHSSLTEEQLSRLTQAWNSTIEPNDMMLRFLENLRGEGAKIALLSNIGSEHCNFLKEKVPEIFNNSVEHLSFEVGARKPSKVYYQSFLMDHPEWTGAIYVDDRDENLRAGKKYSFKTFHFDLEQILQMSKSKQKLELDKIKSYIFDRKYDGVR